jgi:lysophospholipase L1-like esterase
MTRVVALGDSFTCGEGVGVHVPPSETWVALLAGALPGGRLTSLALPGARVADVRAGQLPLLNEPVDVATLLVGLNDIARSGFSADAVRDDLLACVAALRGHAREVLVGRLHDPTTVLRLPARLSDSTRRRVSLVNGVIDRAGTWPGVRVLDLARVPELGVPGGWAVDRIHPSPAGHRGIAIAAAACLATGGRHPVTPVAAGVVPRGPSRSARGRWVVRHAVPYAAAHARELTGPLASALLGRR